MSNGFVTVALSNKTIRNGTPCTRIHVFKKKNISCENIFIFLIVVCYLDMTRFQKSYKQYEESIKTLLAFRGSIGALISFPIICSWSLNSIPLQLLQMYKHDRIISLVTQIPFDLNRPNFFHN